MIFGCTCYGTSSPSDCYVGVRSWCRCECRDAGHCRSRQVPGCSHGCSLTCSPPPSACTCRTASAVSSSSRCEWLACVACRVHDAMLNALGTVHMPEPDSPECTHTCAHPHSPSTPQPRPSRIRHPNSYRQSIQFYKSNFTEEDWPHGFWSDFEEYPIRPADCTRDGELHRCLTVFRYLGPWDNAAQAVGMW